MFDIKKELKKKSREEALAEVERMCGHPKDPPPGQIVKLSEKAERNLIAQLRELDNFPGKVFGKRRLSGYTMNNKTKGTYS